MSNQKRIILYPNAERDIGLEMTHKVKSMLVSQGRDAVICATFEADTLEAKTASDFKEENLENELAAAEMIITFGGDGTILRAARAAADLGVPILGVNMGGKGFMTELEVDDVELIAAAATGRYKLDKRMMLDVEVFRNGEIVSTDYALNDVVVKGDNKVIELTLYADNQRISNFSGDGAVIATPTGSTAYSMAAGGPIVEPSAHNIIITPICAHVIETKSFVLIPDRCVSVEIGFKKHNPAYISVDGGDHISIQGGDVVNVRKSRRYTCLVNLSDRSFYSKVSEKLGDRA